MKKQHFYFLLVFLLPILGVLWWWGLFRAPELDIAERGPYQYVYVESQGAYSRLADRQHIVAEQLRAQGITAGRALTIIYDDPRTTKPGERHARVGYLVPVSASPKAPLLHDMIPMRRVVVASIKAHPLVAYGKVYGTLLDFAKRQNDKLHLPTVETYENSVLTVEMPLETQP